MTNKAKDAGQVEGEGSYSGTKAYNKSTEEFLKKARSVRLRGRPSVRSTPERLQS